MTKLLNRIAELLGSFLAAHEFPRARLRYRDTFALRQQLGERFAPATANLALAALRGILRESWRLGRIDHEDYQRAIDLAAFRGKPRPAPTLPSSAIEQMMEHCGHDRSPVADATTPCSLPYIWADCGGPSSPRSNFPITAKGA